MKSAEGTPRESVGLVSTIVVKFMVIFKFFNHFWVFSDGSVHRVAEDGFSGTMEEKISLKKLNSRRKTRSDALHLKCSVKIQQQSNKVCTNSKNHE